MGPDMNRQYTQLSRVRMARVTQMMEMTRAQVLKWPGHCSSPRDHMIPVEDQMARKENVRHDINMRP